MTDNELNAGLATIAAEVRESSCKHGGMTGPERSALSDLIRTYGAANVLTAYADECESNRKAVLTAFPSFPYLYVSLNYWNVAAQESRKLAEVLRSFA